MGTTDSDYEMCIPCPHYVAVWCGPTFPSDDVVFSFQTELMNNANLHQHAAIGATVISFTFTFYAIILL